MFLKIKEKYSYIYYILLNFLYKIFISNGKPIRNDNIAILAKGESLKLLYSHFFYRIKNLDLFILVNFKGKDILDFSLKKYIKNTPLTIIGNITEPLMSLMSCVKLKIYEVYIQRFKEKRLNSTGLFSKRVNYRLNSYSLKVNYLNQYIYKYYKKIEKTYKFSNCGLFAVLLACSYKPKNIFIFGMDFYETNYFNMKLLDNMSRKEMKRCHNEKEWYKKFLFKIISDHPKINFFIFTRAKFNFQIKNLKVLKYD